MKFEIVNSSKNKIDIEIEPECWWFTLEAGQSATVSGEYEKTPITFRLADDPKGGICASVIPGDGEILVEKDGKNVLDDWVA
jgi:hypothetical protein